LIFPPANILHPALLEGGNGANKKQHRTTTMITTNNEVTASYKENSAITCGSNLVIYFSVGRKEKQVQAYSFACW